jgi:hypothetical protein
MPHKCQFKLDQRPSSDLLKVCEEAYMTVQSLTASILSIKCNRRGRPDPVQLWLLYIAGLTFGAAQASLTLILHNLQREALAFQRIVVEIVGRAYYYRNHPREARLEIDAESFRELKLLNRLKYDRRKTRYRRVKAAWEEIRKRNPSIEKYAKKHGTFKRVMWRRSGRRQDFLYAFYYEIYSRLSHASVLGMRDIVEIGNGLHIKFDSRLKMPDMIVDIIAQYVIVFLELLDEVFELNRATSIQQLKTRLASAHNALLSRLASADGSNKSP